MPRKRRNKENDVLKTEIKAEAKDDDKLLDSSKALDLEQMAWRSIACTRAECR